MTDQILLAIQKGAKLYASISGGKDSQAMVNFLCKNGFKIEELLHCDLGRMEWKESKTQCENLSERENLPLKIVTRKDGQDLLNRFQSRAKKLEGTGKPFWSSSANRYCTSDMKRDPVNVYLNSTGNNFIISCEGIRASESTARAKKSPLSIREKSSSSFYKGMSVEEAIGNFRSDKKLVLTWFPIFNFSNQEVWNTEFETEGEEQMLFAREVYKTTGEVPAWFPFHPAYVYGNDRVSCAICVLASRNDITNGAKHNPVLLQELIALEVKSGFTFQHNFSLQSINL
jgi:3'-phosphoadenosine 5'-phosphosulfate sulfotransferase (PAPS reductase)/FAD synthetase